MPEGDTILSIAGQLRPVLVDQPVERLLTPQRRHALDRWPQKLGGARVRRIDTHGKHLFLRWDNGLTIHSHLRMSGRWRVFEQGFDQGRLSRAAWLVIQTARHSVVQFRGPILELMRDSRMTFDPYLRRLGPDVLADELDWPAILVRLRSDDPTRPVADALLDQRTLAGIGNLWKNESLYECRIDPWRPLSDVSDAVLEQVVRKAREMMLREVRHGGRLSGGEVFEQGGKGCRRCGNRIRVRGQWDENRMTYWCPTCQK
jgi:endonuclease-8